VVNEIFRRTAVVSRMRVVDSFLNQSAVPHVVVSASLSGLLRVLRKDTVRFDPTSRSFSLSISFGEDGMHRSQANQTNQIHQEATIKEAGMSATEKCFDLRKLRPRITVFGVGGAGGNAVNNMIRAGLQGVDFVVANTDAQALAMSEAEHIIQMGVHVTEGLGAGSDRDVGRAAAEEVLEEIGNCLAGVHMLFIAAGMGGGTGTGASPVVASVAREMGILTIGVVTKPFQFEGQRRMSIAEQGIAELQSVVDTLIIIPNQNLFRVVNEKTTFANAFAMADQVLYSGVACITDLIVKEGLINLDFADVRSVMRGMGKAMMGTGEASGENRALQAADAAFANPLLYDVSMSNACGLLISISGGRDLTLFEVDEAATRIRQEADPNANIIVGAAFDEGLNGAIRVSVVATGVAHNLPITAPDKHAPIETFTRVVGPSGGYEAHIDELTLRLDSKRRLILHPAEHVDPSSTAMALDLEHEDFERVISNASIDAIATAAVAGALFVHETPEPIPPAQSGPQKYESSEFHPSAVSGSDQPKLAFRSRRMPRVDELPLPAQDQIRALGQRLTPEPMKQHMTLLQKLAATLGRQDREDLEEAKPSLMVANGTVVTDADPREPYALEEQDNSRAPAGESHEHPLDIPNFLRR
jgi:cell division protein FtsZ